MLELGDSEPFHGAVNGQPAKTMAGVVPSSVSTRGGWEVRRQLSGLNLPEAIGSYIESGSASMKALIMCRYKISR